MKRCANDPAGIRSAIASGEYDKALDAWHAYARELERSVARGDAGPAALTDARELLDWSRNVLLCANAHAHDLLNTLYIANRYEPPGGPVSQRLLTNI